MMEVTRPSENGEKLQAIRVFWLTTVLDRAIGVSVVN